MAVAHQPPVFVDAALRQRDQAVGAHIRERVPLPSRVLPNHPASPETDGMVQETPTSAQTMPSGTPCKCSGTMLSTAQQTLKKSR